MNNPKTRITSWAVSLLLFATANWSYCADPAAAAQHGNKGNELAQQGKYDEAIQEFTLAIKDNVKDPRFYLDRGRVYRVAKKYPEALADFNKAIEMAPESDVGYYERGKTELEQNQYDPALTDENKALYQTVTREKLDPGLKAWLEGGRGACDPKAA
jgi:tetratricopeptide (TPR) repeat protein